MATTRPTTALAQPMACPTHHSAPPAPHTLVLPRAVLDAALAQAWATPAPQTSTTAAPIHLAHGPLVLQTTWGHSVALVGALRTGGFRRDNAPAVAHGVALLALVADDQPPPTTPTAWEAWLGQAAPRFRLAAHAPNPALVLLWVRRDGRAVAASRLPANAGAASTTAPGTSAEPLWHAITQLHLPGAGMLRVALPPFTPATQATAATPPWWPSPEALRTALIHSAAPQAPDSHAPPANSLISNTTIEDPQGRYSRLAGALGPAVLARLQDSRIAIVGTGRIGSAVAHSLARMGANLLLLEPDVMAPHNLDGDLPPLHEGHPKAAATARFLRGLMRPGAVLDARMLPIASPAAGALLADADVVLCCVDNDAARLWANAWALATLKPFADVATGLHPHGAEADIRCLPPGAGCLACVGGFAQRGQLLQQLQTRQPPPTPVDFRQQRPGSLRSWGMVSAHLGLRLLEHLYSGRLGHALHRRLAETESGGLQVQDSSPATAANAGCPLCGSLLAAGLAAVQPDRVMAIASAVVSAPTA